MDRLNRSKPRLMRVYAVPDVDEPADGPPTIRVVTTDRLRREIATDTPEYAAGYASGQAWAVEATFGELEQMAAAAASPFTSVPGFARGFIRAAADTFRDMAGPSIALAA